MFILMSLTKKSNVSKIRVGRITEYSKGLLKLILELFGVKFKLEKFDLDDYEEDEIEEEENEEESEDDEEDEKNDKSKEVIHEVPNYYLILSCVGYQMDNKNRIEGI